MNRVIAAAAMAAVLASGGLAFGQNYPGGAGAPGAGAGKPATAQPRAGATIVTEQQALHSLRNKGYSYVMGLNRIGAQYVGRAVRNGRTVTVHVDARTGRVLAR